MTKISGGETYSQDGPQCPNCEFTFTPDDPIYYDENGYTKDECQECGLKFTVQVYHSTSWTCAPMVAEDAISEGKK